VVTPFVDRQTCADFWALFTLLIVVQTLAYLMPTLYRSVARKSAPDSEFCDVACFVAWRP
jgi:hypothetical protein